MNSSKLKTALAITIAAFMTVSTAACGQSGTSDNKGTQSQSTNAPIKTDDSKKALTIAYLTSTTKFKDVEKDMAEQLKADENITVEFQIVPDDQYVTLVKSKLASGEVPDVLDYNFPTQNSSDLGASKNMEDLSNEPWVSRLNNAKLVKDPDDGKIYALPRESSSFFGACYYNKKVLKSVGIEDPQPKTYKDFLDILETIKTKGNGVVPFYASNKDSWTTQIFMTLGVPIALSPNDQAVWDKLLANEMKWSDIPEFKEILNDYHDLYKKGYVNKDNLSATYDMAKEAVATGKAAMMLNGEWAATDIMSKWPDAELGAFIIPFKDKLMIGTGAYVQGIFVPKNGKQVENAKKFVNLWSQPKYQNMFWEKNAGFPGFTDVDGGDVLPYIKALVDTYITTGQYCYQINDPMGAASGSFGDLWNYYIEMVAGSSTPDNVLQKFDKKYSDFMKQKNQPGF
ncbi:carbohydrate ABC transporter substrate-binding protein (CUT1 family) [Anaerobacterium chartisolvens]|uniref:Carbohydrate ABC transporter substrate-binding protein (CUT1 family) n=1 Tax=Anaerobacterium chartisolvens TaxID=1297424 RepID=A0A369BDY4_9FIRM|nr:extracellular solute-binding protein [Anaerobacterium chartisolvens]RCX18796.1 carbohydrate ABC transporter substrate-binding protein (CUT1 family) [Anaerobacterium chartisolvens]